MIAVAQKAYVSKMQYDLIQATKEQPITAKQTAIKVNRRVQPVASSLNNLVRWGYVERDRDKYQSLNLDYEITTYCLTDKREHEPIEITYERTDVTYFVNPLEYSIIQCLHNKKNIATDIALKLSRTVDHIESRLYYMVTQNWVEKRHLSPNRVVYLLLVNPDQFQVEDYKMIRSMRFGQKGSVFNHRSELPKEIKDQIGKLNKEGLRRSEICKRLKITKAELLTVMIERNYQSILPTIAQDQLQLIDKKRKIQHPLLKQFREAYQIIKDGLAQNKSYQEITNYLIELDYKNLKGNKMNIGQVRSMINTPPKCLLEDENESTYQETV